MRTEEESGQIKMKIEEVGTLLAGRQGRGKKEFGSVGEEDGGDEGG